MDVNQVSGVLRRPSSDANLAPSSTPLPGVAPPQTAPPSLPEMLAKHQQSLAAWRAHQSYCFDKEVALSQRTYIAKLLQVGIAASTTLAAISPPLLLLFGQGVFTLPIMCLAACTAVLLLLVKQAYCTWQQDKCLALQLAQKRCKYEIKQLRAEIRLLSRAADAQTYQTLCKAYAQNLDTAAYDKFCAALKPSAATQRPRAAVAEPLAAADSQPVVPVAETADSPSTSLVVSSTSDTNSLRADSATKLETPFVAARRARIKPKPVPDIQPLPLTETATPPPQDVLDDVLAGLFPPDPQLLALLQSKAPNA